MYLYTITVIAPCRAKIGDAPGCLSLFQTTMEWFSTLNPKSGLDWDGIGLTSECLAAKSTALRC